jgi:hypothetical protein
MTRGKIFHYLTPNLGALFVLLLVLTGTLNAQDGVAPAANPQSKTTTISYQGHLLDADGQPVNATLPMVFTFYTAPTGGEPVWIEDRKEANAVPVTNGLFNVLLGSVNPLDPGLLNQSLWLGISVDGDEEMTPREMVQIPAMAQRLSQPVMRLLGEKTCNECGKPVQDDIDRWQPVLGSSLDDPMQVTVTTNGGPVLVHMTARFRITDKSRMYCDIQVNGKDYLIAGSNEPINDVACSGSYLLTDLPAGEHTFTVRGYWVGKTRVLWYDNRQIAVYEFLSPENQ